MNDIKDVELGIEEIDDILNISSTINDYLEEFSVNGICQGDILAINNLLELEENTDYPIISYTKDKSFINYGIAQESLISRIIDNIKKIIISILKAYRNFLKFLFDAVDNLIVKMTGKETKSSKSNTKIDRKKIEQEKKVDEIIETVKKEKKEVSLLGGKKKETAINDKPITPRHLELLLTSKWESDLGNHYPSIFDIMKDFFGGKLTDEIWQDYVDNHNEMFKLIEKSILDWWKDSHPLVTTNGNQSYDFTVKTVSILNYVIDQITFRMDWWLEKFLELSKQTKDNIDNFIKSIENQKDADIVNINEEIINKLEDLFKPLDFMTIKKGKNIRDTVFKTYEDFKKVKTKTDDNITFIASLDKLKWVGGIDDLAEKIAASREQENRHKKEINEINERIRREILSKNRAALNRCGHLLKEMQEESNTLFFIAAKLLGFITFIDQKISRNRLNISNLYIALINFGFDLGEVEFSEN